MVGDEGPPVCLDDGLVAGSLQRRAEAERAIAEYVIPGRLLAGTGKALALRVGDAVLGFVVGVCGVEQVMFVAVANHGRRLHHSPFPLLVVDDAERLTPALKPTSVARELDYLDGGWEKAAVPVRLKVEIDLVVLDVGARVDNALLELR